MVPNAAARQCGGRMNGHVSFPLPFMQTNLQGYNYSTYKQRAGQALANGNPTAGACQLPHEAALITMLPAASPDQRKEILGQKLYPKFCFLIYPNRSTRRSQPLARHLHFPVSEKPTIHTSVVSPRKPGYQNG
ncbi:hypothetical protein OWV82_003907 [Melia azedarach]|uniref:Uncharacterized protein n=1 Tax=Melia azedarach TaxID=155640 RepID=A0ACC1YNC6_MELAZ|nr:hypothetical protein OWV82_003907 [Melia azedarach]